MLFLFSWGLSNYSIERFPNSVKSKCSFQNVTRISHGNRDSDKHEHNNSHPFDKSSNYKFYIGNGLTKSSRTHLLTEYYSNVWIGNTIKSTEYLYIFIYTPVVLIWNPWPIGYMTSINCKRFGTWWIEHNTNVCNIKWFACESNKTK